MSESLRRVTVVGAGTMGHGIAHAAAVAGCSVTLTDSQPDALAQAAAKIDLLLAGGLKRGKITEAELVIEAIVEQLPAKRLVFEPLDDAAPGTALLATNTSSLSVAQIAATVRDPSRVIGLHFFNPVHIMRLVEVA